MAGFIARQRGLTHSWSVEQIMTLHPLPCYPRLSTPRTAYGTLLLEKCDLSKANTGSSLARATAPMTSYAIHVLYVMCHSDTYYYIVYV